MLNGEKRDGRKKHPSVLLMNLLSVVTLGTVTLPKSELSGLLPDITSSNSRSGGKDTEHFSCGNHCTNSTFCRLPETHDPASTVHPLFQVTLFSGLLLKERNCQQQSIIQLDFQRRPFLDRFIPKASLTSRKQNTTLHCTQFCYSAVVSNCRGHHCWTPKTRKGMSLDREMRHKHVPKWLTGLQNKGWLRAATVPHLNTQTMSVACSVTT